MYLDITYLSVWLFSFKVIIISHTNNHFAGPLWPFQKPSVWHIRSTLSALGEQRDVCHLPIPVPNAAVIPPSSQTPYSRFCKPWKRGMKVPASQTVLQQRTFYNSMKSSFSNHGVGHKEMDCFIHRPHFNLTFSSFLKNFYWWLRGPRLADLPILTLAPTHQTGIGSTSPWWAPSWLDVIILPCPFRLTSMSESYMWTCFSSLGNFSFKKGWCTYF